MTGNRDIAYLELEFGKLRIRLKFALPIRFHTTTQAGVAQLVEHDLAKVGVASSSLVSRSDLFGHLIIWLFGH